MAVIMTRLFLLVLVYCASYQVEGNRARLLAQSDGMATVVKDSTEKPRFKRVVFYGSIFQAIKGGKYIHKTFGGLQEQLQDITWLGIYKRIKSLTKAAVSVVYSATRQLYRKKGGLQEAIKDFESVRPTNVNVIQTGDGIKQTGTVGNMRIEIQERRDIGTAVLSLSNISDGVKQGGNFMTEIMYY